MSRFLTCPNCSSRRPAADGSAGQAVACPRCGKPFPVAAHPNGGNATLPLATPSDAPAATIGRYQVRQKLGAGAFGAVYRAYDPQLDREVALKLLKPEALGSTAAVERFRREARAAAKMLHAHVVPVFDSGEHEGAGYIASALIEGKPLSQSIPEGGMEPT